MKQIYFLLSLLFYAFSASAQMSGVYTVDVFGNGDYPSMQEAAEDLNSQGMSGDVTLEIQPGTYSEQAFFEIPNQNPDHTLIIQGMGSDPQDVVFDYIEASEEENYQLGFQDIKSLEIRNISVYTVDYDQGIGIELRGLTGDVLVADFHHQGNRNDEGIRVGYAVDFFESIGLNSLEVKDSYFTLASNSISVAAVQFVEPENPIQNVYVHHNTFFDADGLGAQQTTNVRFEENTCQGSEYRVQPLELNSCTGEIRVMKNNIWWSFQTLKLNSCIGTPENPILVANNLVSGSYELTEFNGNSYLRVVYNSFYGDDDSDPMIANFSNEDSEFLNNIFNQNNSEGTIFIDYGVSDPATYDYNCLYSNGAYSQVFDGTFMDLNFEEYQAQTGRETNGISVPPVFVEPGVDLHATNSNLNVALPLPDVLDDFDGELRSTTNPSIGGDELDGVLIITDLTIDDVVTDDEVDAGDQLLVSWSGQNAGNTNLQAPWTDAIYLSDDTELDEGDTELGTYQRDTDLAPESPYNHESIVNIPVDVSGPNFIIVRVNVNADLNEDNSNNVAVSELLTINEPPLPDIMVTAIQMPDDVFSGTTLEIAFTVTNNGDVVASGQWVDRVWMATDPEDFEDEEFFENHQPFAQTPNPIGLSPGESYTTVVSATMPAAGQGLRYVVVDADANNNLLEASGQEGNLAMSPLDSVYVNQSPLADLVVENFQVPTETFAGQDVDISYTIRNIGTAETAPVPLPFNFYFGYTWAPLLADWVDYTYVTDSSLVYEPEAFEDVFSRLGSLSPGEAYLVTETIQIPECVSGPYFVVGFADRWNHVVELDETNNELFSDTIHVIAQPSPDLIPNSDEQLTGWASNQVNTLTYTIENDGADTANVAWMDRVFVSDSTEMQFDPDEIIAEVVRDTIIPPGENLTFEIQVETPASVYGDKYLYLWVDAQNAICEYQFDTNNIIQIPVFIEQSLSADLLSFFDQPAPSLVAGDELELNFTIANDGPAETNVSQWKDAIFLNMQSSPITDTAYAEYYLHSGILAAGGEFALPSPFLIPLDLEPGTYTLSSYANVHGAVWENESEGNNLFVSEQFQISLDSSRVPDIRPIEIMVQEILVSGSSYPVTVRFANDEAPTGIASWIDVVQLLDGSGDVISEVTGPYSGSLASDATYETVFDIDFPLGYDGQMSLRAIADTAESVLQYNHQNDTLVFAVDVQPGVPADLAASSFVYPDQVYAGQQIAISVLKTNNGPGDLVNESWVNRLLLSSDNTPDENDLVIFSEVMIGSNFPAGQSQPLADTSFIPSGYAGDYFLIFQMDANHDIFENGQEANNIVVSESPIEVAVQQPIDLLVSLESINVNNGDISSIEYTIENPTANDFAGQFYNSYFISTDPIFSEDDKYYYTELVREGDFPYWNIDLPAGGSHTRATYPHYKPLAPGDYYIIQKVDISSNVYEVDENNNTFVFGPVFIDNVREIFPDITYEEQFRSVYSKDYYKIDIPDGTGMITKLWENEQANEPEGSINDNKPIYEVYIGEERIPSALDYDFKFDSPLQNDQTVLVPTAPARTDFILGNAPYIPPVADPDSVPATNYYLRAEFREFSVYSMEPKVLGTSHCTTLRIKGFDFVDPDGFDIGLVLDGDTTWAFEVYPQSNALINAYIDMREKPAGEYDLVVRKIASGSTTVWEEKVEVIEDQGALPYVNVIAPGGARSGQDFQVQVAYENKGFSNEYDLLLMVVFTFGDTSGEGINGRFLGSNAIQLNTPGPEVDELNPPGELLGVFDYGVVYGMYIPILHAQQQEVLTFELNCDAWGELTTYSSFFMLQRSAYTFTGRIRDYETSDYIREMGNAIAQADGALEAATGAKSGDCSQTLDADAMTLEILQETKKVAEKARGAEGFWDSAKRNFATLTGTQPSLKQRYDAYKELAEAKGELSITADEDTPFASQLQGVFNCIGEDNITTTSEEGCYDLKSFTYDGVAYTVRVNSCVENTGDGEGFTNDIKPDDNENTDVRQPSDPNEIVGPAGEGPLRLVDGEDIYQYTVYFENIAEATAPAVRVRIDNPIDSSLKASTFRIQSFGFADTVYYVNNAPFIQNTYGLDPAFGNQALRVLGGTNPASGKAFFEFNTINPQTQALATGPDDGFLFPNDSTGRGQGFVTYTISAKDDLEVGTEFKNKAAIIFDENEIIETNTWTNVISGGNMDSEVEFLPEFSPANFLVSWVNLTPAFGPPVQSFDIYYRVKDEGNSWNLWLDNTRAMSKRFTGVEGKTYQFRSVANGITSRESLGELEDAETTVFKFSGSLGDDHMLIFPNPATDYTQVAYRSPSEGHGIQLDISDAQGRIVDQHKFAAGGAGTQFFMLNTRSYNPGVYIVTLRMNGFKETARLVVIGQKRD